MKSDEIPKLTLEFPENPKKFNSGPYYPQKHLSLPLTPFPMLLRVGNRRTIELYGGLLLLLTRIRVTVQKRVHQALDSERRC